MYDSYTQYQKLMQQGLKKKAHDVAREVVKEYERQPDPDFLVGLTEPGRQRINHILWRGIIYPFVRHNLQSNPVAVKCLINTIQNLYSDREAHEQLNWITEGELIERYLMLVPDDPWAIEKKTQVVAVYLQFSIHEWPAGILYGNHAASSAQCEELLQTINELRMIDAHKNYRELCDDAENKIREYQNRLNEK